VFHQSNLTGFCFLPGKVLAGRPEARFEAYARAFAGCGPYTTFDYRRSYARQYESICCATHQSDDTYTELFDQRPTAIIGRFVRLEAMAVDRHLNELFQMTDGSPRVDKKAYDPLEVWGFQPEGPFRTPSDMHKSFVFQRKFNEAGFVMVHSVTERITGVILLTNDAPEHLSIQMEPPIMAPNSHGTQQQMEACFLLLDRLFAYGYRRIQMAVDSQDPDGNKLANRLGFTFEGVLLRHMVLKDASRDSSVYGLLNSDWKKGARAVLFGKLYGDAALRVDQSNEQREAENDEQSKQLAEMKEKEKAMESKK
jgi:RimJ/RimL family protein N-acetyltransferase